MKEKMISAIYKILLLYEDINNPNSQITEEDYLKYINRQYIRFLGKGNEEIYSSLRGLFMLGEEASHNEVKSLVFHLIDVINREIKDEL